MSFDNKKYGKILVPMMTPFRKDDQSVDLDVARSLADHLIASKNADTLIISGTTGEFHTMDYAERETLLGAIHEHVAGRMPLVAGVGCASTIETVKLAKAAEKIGYETVMVVAPYYAKPNQSEIYHHYRAVAEATSCNVMVYNIPIFTGVNVDPDTLGRLAEIPNIIAVKEEAELNPKQMTAFLNATPEDFIVYNGDDTMILEAYAQGGPERIGGVISGASHLIGNQVRTMIETFLAGKIAEAAAMQRAFFPLFRVMSQNNRTNPAALWKDALRIAGVEAGYPRLPLSPGSDDEKANIRAVLTSLKLI
jgi:4-hydroxy-tetrahydrodipicolinate synthase